MGPGHNLIGRTFSYCLNRDGKQPLLIVANVKPPPSGLELPEGTVWVRAFSSDHPEGEEGTVSAFWMQREIAPSTARMLKGMFEYGADTSTVAPHFPLRPGNPAGAKRCGGDAISTQPKVPSDYQAAL
jgi:hypothetical protein